MHRKQSFKLFTGKELFGMGEIIVSIVIGACLVISGISMICVLSKEQKNILKSNDNKNSK